MSKKFLDFLTVVMMMLAFAFGAITTWMFLHDEKPKQNQIIIPAHVAKLSLSADTTLEPPETPVEYADDVERPFTYDKRIPLPESCQTALYEACEANDVSVPLALGLIEVESCFDINADNGISYGLCQLNKQYFQNNLSPEDNIRYGIEYLGKLLKQYGDTAAALCAYNAGYDTGNRGYATAVLEVAEWWEDALK